MKKGIIRYLNVLESLLQRKISTLSIIFSVWAGVEYNGQLERFY